MLEQTILEPNLMLAGGVTNSIGLVINSTNPLSPQNGGSGVSNSFNITLGGALTTAAAFSTSGANALTLTTTGTTNVTFPTTGTLVNTAVTTLSSLSSIGTITTGTWNGSIITGTYGGTGVNNGANTITLAGNLTTSGAFPLTLTTTGSTNVTFPTTGTLVNTAVTTLSSLSSIGTITTGVWNASVIGPTYGGTGINNGSNTITVAGNFATSGSFPITLTATGATNVTLPTSGTLSTVGANGVTVTNVTGTSVTMTDSAAINIYVANNASQVTLTLPATTTVGHVFKIIGAGAGGWKIAQLAAQSIDFQNNGANVATTTGTGGSLSSNLSTDCIEFAATVANTTFTATSIYGGQISYV